ncbi:DYNAMIN-like 1E isoform 1 [Hibiscus syriacus]|uniref:DYNAMIN-like 1E isoform 1 n=1 Tax=Hibiscus syriacus TaxID=106335 RepID=A0A6A2Y3T5_HIBSY|nr:DYNAMIN-like 1E isoform 1 [Hibiscus syriacus]
MDRRSWVKESSRSDCERAKPYPDPYLKALEVLKVSKGSTFCEVSLLSQPRVAAGMSVVGLTTRNPKFTYGSYSNFSQKDYEEPKLWEALEELDKRG